MTNVKGLIVCTTVNNTSQPADTPGSSATFSVYPFLKWAGGKRWLVQRYPELFSVRYRRFVELFAGSAAVFYYLQPDSAVLSDINEELIETYRAIRNDWQMVCSLLN